MKIRLCGLMMTFILMLGIGGCTQAAPQASAQTEAPSSPVQSEAPPIPVQSETPLSPAPTVYVDSTLENFHIAIASDALLNEYDSYHEYIGDEVARLIIWTDTVIKDFAFIAVDYEETEDHRFNFFAGDELFSLDELTPEKPFVADILPPETLPFNGISFLDIYGVKRYFCIQADGRGAEEAPPYFFLEFDNGGPVLPAAEIVPLTAEELASYNKIFVPTLFNEQKNFYYSNPISQFLTSYYSRPQDINLVKFLWYYQCDGLVTDEAEFETLKDAEHWNFGTAETLDDMPVPIRKTSADTVNKALEKYMGITLADHSGIGTEKLPYLKAADTYYTFTSDCSSACFVCVSGEKQGDMVRLYSADAVLTLKLRDDGFWFVSHQPL